VFLVDQPGIGGLKVNEAAYLETFGPGHFNWTFMLGEKGKLLRYSSGVPFFTPKIKGKFLV